jgi:hypothetical protein
MGRDIIHMVEAMMFMGAVMLACVTVLVIGLTGLLILMGWDLTIELWGKLRYN